MIIAVPKKYRLMQGPASPLCWLAAMATLMLYYTNGNSEDTFNKLTRLLTIFGINGLPKDIGVKCLTAISPIKKVSYASTPLLPDLSAYFINQLLKKQGILFTIVNKNFTKNSDNSHAILIVGASEGKGSEFIHYLDSNFSGVKKMSLSHFNHCVERLQKNIPSLYHYDQSSESKACITKRGTTWSHDGYQRSIKLLLRLEKPKISSQPQFNLLDSGLLHPREWVFFKCISKCIFVETPPTKHAIRWDQTLFAPPQSDNVLMLRANVPLSASQERKQWGRLSQRLLRKASMRLRRHDANSQACRDDLRVILKRVYQHPNLSCS